MDIKKYIKADWKSQHKLLCPVFHIHFYPSSKLKHLKLISLAKQTQLIHRFRDIVKRFYENISCFYVVKEEVKVSSTT